MDYLARLRTAAGAALLGESADPAGQAVLQVKTGALVALAQLLRDELGFKVLLDVVGLDFSALEPAGERFGIDYVFLNPVLPARLRLSVRVTESACRAPTLARLYRSADWLEREVFDQLGIVFDGHPDLRRILNHAEFVGHPLRKDFPIDGRQPLSRAEPLDLE